MTDEQWEKLLAVLNGELIQPLAVGFLIDSPWLCDLAEVSTLDYSTQQYSAPRCPVGWKARRYP
jgi:uroporphyrinogen decarboxylase